MLKKRCCQYMDYRLGGENMSKQKVKVLHLLSSNKFSGAENVVFQIINLFKDDNFDMVYSSKEGQIREACVKEKINFYPLKKINTKEVRKVIKEFQPDIIHAHDVKASVIASFFSQNAQIVSHIHCNYEDMRIVNLKTLLFLLRAKKFEHIFWVSNSAFEKYRFNNKLKKKSSILYNVIDSEKIIAKSQDDLNHYNYDVVYLGRLSYPKNPERLIDVLIKAIQIKKNLKMAIIGTGDLEENVKNRAEKLGIQDNISFLGFQSNPMKILKDAKVMLMTSRFEGTPMCALEAMALGVPIVSTPIDGLVDIITDGVEGYLSEDNTKLAEKIVEIVEKKELHEELSKNSIEKFSVINDLEKYKRILLDVYYVQGEYTNEHIN